MVTIHSIVTLGESTLFGANQSAANGSVVFCTSYWFVWRARRVWKEEERDWNREKKSLRHVTMETIFLDRHKPCFCKYGFKKRNEKKLTCNDFPWRDCTQEQNGSPYLFHRSTMQIAVSFEQRDVVLLLSIKEGPRVKGNTLLFLIVK